MELKMRSWISVAASASQPTLSSPPSLPQSTRFCCSSRSFVPCTLSSSDLKLQGVGFSRVKGPHGIRIRCNSSTGPGGSGSGDDSRSVLDAFFLGKALAEALNERIESTLGEFLSSVGRLQAEQQKQVQDFQEDVLERAKRAKERAAREAMGVQGLIPKSTAEGTTPATADVNLVTSGPATDAGASASPPSLSGPTTSPAQPEPDATADDEEPVLGVSKDV